MAETTETAVWLATEPDPTLAFLHLPATGKMRGVAALLCPPFGWDEVSSYRARRRWTERLAQAGFPAARIALPGTGDSGGTPREPDRLAAWTNTVAHAAEWLRERTASARLAAIGIGLGGLVAVRALADGAAIDDLLLWAVPSSGRTLVREMRAYAGVVAARYPADATGRPASADPALELIGFLMSGETACALEQVRLNDLKLPEGQLRRALLVGRDRMAADRRLAAHLRASGATVEVVDDEAEDFSRLTAHPQEAQLPEGVIARSTQWLEQGAEVAQAADGRASTAPIPRREALGVPAGEAVGRLSLGDAVVRETPIGIEVPGGHAFGILTEPIDRDLAPATAILLSAGALNHAGPNRMWVELARRWAAQGVATARIDLPGIGDAGGDERTLVSNPALYDPARVAQTLAVADALSRRGLPDRYVLGGLCAGAYWSLHAAVANPSVVAALMVNLYAFEWSEALVAERETRDTLDALRRRVWRRLARRDFSTADVRAAVATMTPRRIRMSRRFPVEHSQRGQVEAFLQRLREQETISLFLLSHDEPLYDQLMRQGVVERAQDWPNLSIERIPSRDHMFRALWLQDVVGASMSRTLDRALERLTRGATASLG